MGLTSLRRHHVNPQYGSAPKSTYTLDEHKDALEHQSRALRQERDVELDGVRASHAAELSELRSQITRLEVSIEQRQKEHAEELDRRIGRIELDHQRRANPKRDEQERKDQRAAEEKRQRDERLAHKAQQASLPQTKGQMPQDEAAHQDDVREREEERLAEEKRQEAVREEFRQQQASLPHAQQPGRGFVEPGPEPMIPGETLESREAFRRQVQPAVPWRGKDKPVDHRDPLDPADGVPDGSGATDDPKRAVDAGQHPSAASTQSEVLPLKAAEPDRDPKPSDPPRRRGR